MLNINRAVRILELDKILEMLASVASTVGAKKRALSLLPTSNIETVKRRIPGIDKRATFLKVLARGTLNKKLIVDADDYSLDAEKMILLVGGKVLSTAVEEEEDEE